MKRTTLFLLVLTLLPATLFGAGGDVHYDSAHVDVTDKAALQRGGKYFVNYCLSCHSAAFMRYSRAGRDLGLSDEQVMEHLIFTDAKIGDTMTVAMRVDDAKKWFNGAPAPDLSVIARARGADWLYTYLRSFYLDSSRPTGANNLVLKNATMPHVLWELQGWQTPVYAEGDHGAEDKKVESLELAMPGTLSPREYDRVVRDIVTFLVYLGEPAQLERQRLGFRVLLFLIVLFGITYLMKKAYWKDVH